MLPASAFDTAAPSFDMHRALPDGVPEAVRAAVLSTTGGLSRPCFLDLGAGTGRIGIPFVVAGDDYVGADVSLGMLREFARRVGAHGGRTPRLAQASGETLPFRDATFDVVLLIQVIAAARGWRQLIAEAQRVLRSPGVLITGQTVMPPDGLDAQMKQRLASLLDQLGAPSYHANVRPDAQQWLESVAQSSTHIVAAAWSADRTPRGFLNRQPTGASFSALPVPIKEEVLSKLSAWAAAKFGSLDSVFSEQHAFELRIFRF